MMCPKCGCKMFERVIHPVTSDKPVTLYSCNNYQCEFDEELMHHRRRWLQRMQHRR